jgi:hypothetical protein
LISIADPTVVESVNPVLKDTFWLVIENVCLVKMVAYMKEVFADSALLPSLTIKAKGLVL